jgi:hypothetical protein
LFEDGAGGFVGWTAHEFRDVGADTFIGEHDVGVDAAAVAVGVVHPRPICSVGHVAVSRMARS